MRPLLARVLVTTVMVSAAACASRPDDTGNPDNPAPDAGTTVTPPGADAGDPAAAYTTTTIANAITNATALHAVHIANGVVIAEYHYGTPVQGTFYIQDGSGPGIAVYKSSKDTVDYPAIGDIVTVQGHFSRFNGSLQISSSTKFSQPLAVTITGKGGTVPAPEQVGATSGYAPGADPHDAQVGHVLQFTGDLSVTNARALVSTGQDGGTKVQGFEVTGGLLVDDAFVYYDCLRGLDGGVGSVKMGNGIRGVWDHYQDFSAGSSSNPAPTVPVLFPTSCSDLSPAPN